MKDHERGSHFDLTDLLAEIVHVYLPIGANVRYFTRVQWQERLIEWQTVQRRGGYELWNARRRTRSGERDPKALLNWAQRQLSGGDY